MADGINNTSYAGVAGFGVVNDLDGLETAIHDASASGKRLVVSDIGGNDRPAYFISSESSTARTVRNIKAFFGHGENGRVHDARVKDALLALANKKSVDGFSSQDRFRARGIADAAKQINSNTLAGNAVKTFKALIASVTPSPTPAGSAVVSHDYESIDESGDGGYEYVGSYRHNEDDYSYPNTPDDNNAETDDPYSSDTNYSRLSDIDTSRADAYEIPHGQYEPEKGREVSWRLGAALKMRSRDFDESTARTFIENNQGRVLQPFGRDAFTLPGPGTKPEQINGAFRDAANLAGVRTENIHLLSALFKSSAYEERANKVLSDPTTVKGHTDLVDNPGAQQIYVIARLLDDFITQGLNAVKTLDEPVLPTREAPVVNSTSAPNEEFTASNTSSRAADDDEQFTALDPNTRVQDEEEYTSLNYRVPD